MTRLALFLMLTITASTRAADAPPLPPPDAKAVEPAAIELAGRADAGDTAFIAKLMTHATKDAAADMIERIKWADVRRTYASHLTLRGPDAAGLNYHDPYHFQVELKKDAAGKWELARLWFCR